MLGACGSGTSSDGPPLIEVTGQTRSDRFLTLTVHSEVKLYNIWAATCRYGRPPRLQKLENGVWTPLRDDRPMGSPKPPYCA